MKITRVENMRSSNGKKVANQFIIHATHGRYFQSYDTVVAYIPCGEDKIALDHDYEYSRTTMKYLGMFLGHNIAETRKRVNDGRYLVVSLNKE